MNQPSLFPDVAPTASPAADLELVQCRGCKRFMAWVGSTNYRAVPLDPEPVHDGNLIFVVGAQPTVRYLRKGEAVPEGTARFKSHFATCPNAADFRRRR